MRFVLIDRIIELNTGQVAGRRQEPVAGRGVPGRPFPGFPGDAGVLMLEALTQAGAWLIRDMEDFAHSVIVLKQAKTIKYGSFVEPGRQLQLRVELVAHGERESDLQGGGVDRRPGDGQGAVHPDALQPPRARPGAARDRRVDRRRAARPVRDAPQGFGRGPGDGPDRPARRRRRWRWRSGSRAVSDPVADRPASERSTESGQSGRWPRDDVARISENQQDSAARSVAAVAGSCRRPAQPRATAVRLADAG